MIKARSSFHSQGSSCLPQRVASKGCNATLRSQTCRTPRAQANRPSTGTCSSLENKSWLWHWPHKKQNPQNSNDCADRLCLDSGRSSHRHGSWHIHRTPPGHQTSRCGLSHPAVRLHCVFAWVTSGYPMGFFQGRVAFPHF